MSPGFDLLIRAGRVFCARTGLDGPGAVAVQGDRIAASGPGVDGGAEHVLDFPDGLLLPGLVDLHAHPDRGGSRYGVDPDLHMLPRGVTTVLSQGDAGAANWPRYRERVIQASRVRVRLALNLAARGESGPAGCFADLADADVDACVGAIEAARRDGCAAIWGIAVNTSRNACAGTDPREVLHRALQAADRAACPLLVGTRRADDWPLEEQLPLIRPGDVVTYCFHAQSQGILRDGCVRDVVWRARDRGVHFDLGHGAGSFSFRVAETAIAEGFVPDTLSTDFYRAHLAEEPPHDLPRVLSKLIAAGMPEAEAFARVTARPAEVLGLAGDIGTLRPGACADLAVLGWNPAAAPLMDTQGDARAGGCWEPAFTVRSGAVVGSEGDGP